MHGNSHDHLRQETAKLVARFIWETSLVSSCVSKTTYRFCARRRQQRKYIRCTREVRIRAGLSERYDAWIPTFMWTCMIHVLALDLTVLNCFWPFLLGCCLRLCKGVEARVCPCTWWRPWSKCTCLIWLQAISWVRKSEWERIVHVIKHGPRTKPRDSDHREFP